MMKNKKIYFQANPAFIITFLLAVMNYSYFVYAQEITVPGKSSEIEMEKKILEDAENQKTTQLKEYFRHYYYKQGREYFKNGRYQEAMAQFQRALHWDPGYKPALQYIKLIENKTGQQLKPEEKKTAIIPDKTKELAKEAEEKAEAKKEPSKKISQENKVEKVTAEELVSGETASANIAYRIDKEDLLDVSVWRHPELSREVIVRPDGMISFPLIGDIKALGLTVPELDEEITQGLSEFAQKRLKPSISKEAKDKAAYLIGPGDTLDISVWKEADLSRKVIVRPDGMISFPLVGDMQAVGKTLTELDGELTKSLSSYVKEPQVAVMVESFGWKKEVPAEVFLEESPEVSVTIKKFGGRKVIILGDVMKPGVYTFTNDIRLIEALALAGDCTKFAVKNNILVIRGDIHQKPTVISANIASFIKNAKLNENILIQPQDVIFVPRSLIGNVNAFVETIGPWIDIVYKGSTTRKDLETGY